MIGFSAGAIITLKTVLDTATDADAATRPPNFFGYVYGPMDAVPVPPDAPPMFVALAMDDPIFGRGDFSLVSAWHAASRPVELHVYQTGQRLLRLRRYQRHAGGGGNEQGDEDCSTGEVLHGSPR